MGRRWFEMRDCALIESLRMLGRIDRDFGLGSLRGVFGSFFGGF